MGTQRKADVDVTEDLATKGALFDIEQADGTKVRIVLPALDGEPELDPER
jgi:hypothetical protein